MFGIIGGTGLYSIEGLTLHEDRSVETPFGEPSAPVRTGKLGSADVAFLPRHGEHHQILPSEINFRANIYALKAVGVRRIISVSAVGSLAQEICPGDLAIPNQYFDFTKGKRESSFFGKGLVAHISTAQPSCPALSARILQTAEKTDIKLHAGKAYACVEGPRLGTRVESFFLKNNGCHLVGMTNVPEVFLAREAQLCYSTIAVPTDYDCWLEDPTQHVTVDQVLALYSKNIGRIQILISNMLQSKEAFSACSCNRSLDGAVLTHEAALSPEKKALLEFLRR